MHSLNLLSHMAPMALLLLLPLAVLLERDAPAAALALARSSRAFAPMLALNCGVAAGVNLANFLVTRATSALTLQVLGKAKSVLAVAVSLLVFRNPVSLLGLGGYAVCLAGVVAYGNAKSRAHAGSGGGDVSRMAPQGAAAGGDAALPTVHARKPAARHAAP